jgi:hypothetical protein
VVHEIVGIGGQIRVERFQVIKFPSPDQPKAAGICRGDVGLAGLSESSLGPVQLPAARAEAQDEPAARVPAAGKADPEHRNGVLCGRRFAPAAGNSRAKFQRERKHVVVHRSDNDLCQLRNRPRADKRQIRFSTGLRELVSTNNDADN